MASNLVAMMIKHVEWVVEKSSTTVVQGSFSQEGLHYSEVAQSWTLPQTKKALNNRQSKLLFFLFFLDLQTFLPFLFLVFLSTLLYLPLYLAFPFQKGLEPTSPRGCAERWAAGWASSGEAFCGAFCDDKSVISHSGGIQRGSKDATRGSWHRY